MLNSGVLLSCLAQTALALSTVTLESAVVNAAEAKGSSFLQTGATRKTAVEEMRERAMKLQEDLSKMPSDGLGVKEAEEAAFNVPIPVPVPAKIAPVPVKAKIAPVPVPVPVQAKIAPAPHLAPPLAPVSWWHFQWPGQAKIAPAPHLAPPLAPHLNAKQKALFEAATVTHIAATHTSGDAAVFTRLAAQADEMALNPPAAPEEDMMDEDADEEGGGMGDHHPTTRPNDGNAADVVTFGLFAKTFYGVNLITNSFVIDTVMTLKWVDKRVASLIPAGMDSMTLSKKESENQIWLPGMVVTNRDIKKYDLISTAVFINKKGEVFKVERSTAIVKNKFILDDFPFDRQNLVVKIASHKYMIDDVMLKPATVGIGVKKGLLEGESYDYVKFSVTSHKDIDGALKKSRGLLTIVIDRALDKYTQSHIVPSFLVMMISWAVFYFPFVAPFITPRLAMSILSLLTFTNLSLKSASALPAGAPFNWNDVINQTVMTLMFFTVCLSILSEVCFHQLKIDDVAKAINYECKFLSPFLSITSLTLILSAAGRHGWTTLDSMSHLVQTWMFLIVGTYALYTGSRIRTAQAVKKAAEDAKGEPALIKK